jgi:type II secretion system protein H
VNLFIQKERGQSGFSLVELMVVLLLIGIMTALIVPQMKGTYEGALLRSTARKFTSAMALAYSQSVTAHRPHRFRIDSQSGRFHVERRGQRGEEAFLPLREFAGGEGEFDTRISIEVRKPGEEEAGEEPGRLAPRLNFEAVSSHSHTILFHPDGTAERAEIILKDRQGFGLALRVNPVTGRVKIVELELEEAR